MTDRGQQFEFDLFSSIANILRTERIRKTAYHLASFGLVERFHSQHKAALKSHKSPGWCQTSLLDQLGIRNCLKINIQYSATELAFSTKLR